MFGGRLVASVVVCLLVGSALEPAGAQEAAIEEAAAGAEVGVDGSDEALAERVPASVPELPRVDAGPPAGTEIVALRNERSATFTTERPGVLKSIVSSSPMHVEAAGGGWQPIDVTLVDAGGGKLAPAASSAGVEIDPLATDGNVVSVSLGGGARVGFGFGGSAERRHRVDGSRLVFEEPWPETDVELESMWWGVKETLILASPKSPNVFDFPLVLDGLSYRDRAGGGFELVDKAGVLQGVIPPGFMEDSSSTPERPDNNFSAAVKQEIVANKKGLVLRLTVNRGFLDDPRTVFPVRVDPGICGQGTACTADGLGDDTFVTAMAPNDNSLWTLLRVGYGGMFMNRSFMHFDSDDFANLAGLNVIDARLKVWQDLTVSCDPSLMQVHRVPTSWVGNQAPATSWPGPAVGEVIGEVYDAKGAPGCDAGFLDVEITDAVAKWSSGEWENNGISLRAVPQNSTASFKRLISAQGAAGKTPYLEITYGQLTTFTGPVSLGSNQVWGPENSPYIIDGRLTVAAQHTLTLLPGTVVKFASKESSLKVDGQILSLGTASRPVYFTSIRDDSVGGDTNGDGFKTLTDPDGPRPGDWSLIHLEGVNKQWDSPESHGRDDVLQHTTFRFGGAKYNSPQECEWMVQISSGWGDAIDTRAVVSSSRFENYCKTALYAGTVSLQLFDSTFASEPAFNNQVNPGCGPGGLYQALNGQCPSLVLNGSASSDAFRSRIVGNQFLASTGSSFKVHYTNPYVARNQFNRRIAIQDFSGGTWRFNQFLCPSEDPYCSTNSIYLYSVTSADLKYNWWGHPPLDLPTSTCYEDYIWRHHPQLDSGASGCGGTTNHNISGVEHASWILPMLLAAPAIGLDGIAGESAHPVVGPVDAFWGELRLSEGDLSIVDAGESVDMVRSYRSSPPGAPTAVGVLGTGWGVSFSESLTSAGSTTQVALPSGASTGWAESGAVPNAGNFSSLTPDGGTGGSTVTGVDGNSLRFNAVGELTAVQSRDPGREVQVARAGGEISRVTGVSGRWVDWGYEGGKLKTWTDSQGRQVLFGFDGSGRVSSVKGISGGTSTISYDANGRLTKVTSPMGRDRYRVGYDPAGRVAWFETPGQGRTTVAYFAHLRYANFTDASGAVTAVHWDSAGRTTRRVEAGERASHLVYDGEGNVIVSVTGLPTVPTSGYAPATSLTLFDDRGDPVFQADAHGYSTTTTFDADHQPMLTSTPGPNSSAVTTSRVYDSNKRLVSYTDQMSKVWRSKYNSFGQLTLLADPLSPCNNPDLTCAPTDRAQRAEYTSAGDPEWTENGAQERTTYVVDAHGFTTHTVDPESGSSPNPTSTVTDYWPSGQVKQVTTPEGAVTRMFYNDDDQIVRVETDRGVTPGAEVGVTWYEYYPCPGQSCSLMQRGVSTLAPVVPIPATAPPCTDPRVACTTYGYDELGRPVTRTDADGRIHAREYDPLGQVDAEVDPAGARTEFDYDPAGRPNGIQQQVSGTKPACGSTDPTPEPLTFISESTTYDRMGNPLVVSGPGLRKVEYVYDHMGRETKQIVTRTGSTKYTWQTFFDNADRVTKVRTPVYVASSGHGEQTNTYDDAGRLVSFRNEVGHVTSYQHDDADRVTSERIGVDQLWEIEFDKRGNPKWRRDGAGNRTDFLYDNDGRVTEQRVVRGLDPQQNELFAVTTIDLDLAGQPRSVTDPNQIVTATEFDLAGRALKRVHPDSTFEQVTLSKAGFVEKRRARTGAEWTFVPDAAGRVLEQLDPENGSSNPTVYCYDDLGRNRLTVDPSGLGTYANYNAAGQVVERWTPQTVNNKDTWAYSDDGLLLVQTVAGTRLEFEYNNAGHKWRDRRGVSRTVVATYTLDALGRPTSTIYNGVTNAMTTAYDHRGRLSTTSVTPVTGQPAQTTQHFYDGADRPITKEWPSGREDHWDWNPGGTLKAAKVGSENGAAGPFVASTSYGYDPGGRLRDVTLPRGGVFHYDYEDTGEVSLERRPDNTEWTYDWQAGELQTGTRPSGAVTMYDYDDLGRKTSETVGASTRTFDHDPAGRITRVDNANSAEDLSTRALLVVGDPGSLTVGDVALRDRLEAARLDYVVTVRAAADPEDVGDADVVVVAPSAQLGAKYSEVGLPVVVLGGDAWIDHGLAAAGSVSNQSAAQVSIETPTHRVADGRFARLSGVAAVAAAPGAVSAISDAGVGAGAVHVASRQAAPADGNVVVAYDRGAVRAAGGAAPARRVAVGFGDDVLSALTVSGGDLVDDAVVWARGAERPPSGADLTFGYTNGLLTSASGPFGSVAYGWDGFGRLGSVTPSNAATTTFGWGGSDGHGLLRDMTGGTSLTFAYNTLGQQTQVSSVGGTSSTRSKVDSTFDAAARPTGSTLSRGSTVWWSTSQGYTVDGQVSQRAQRWRDPAGGNLNQIDDVFDYDAAGRMEGFQRSFVDSLSVATMVSGAVGFDADGNRTSLGVSGTVAGPAGSPVAAEAFGVTGDGTTTWAYDLAGKVTGDSRNATYVYDDDGRLEERSVPGGASDTYSYDPFGGLAEVERTEGGVSWIAAAWTRDGLGRPLTHTNAGASYSTYTYGGLDDRVRTHNDRDVTWGRSDHAYTPSGALVGVTTPDSGLQIAATGLHGDLAALTKAVTSVGPSPTVLKTYDPFGTASQVTSMSSPLGFQTQPQDPTTGIVDAGARQYLPELGVFLQADTYRGDPTSPVTLNRYAYANNDPASQWDPTGYLSIGFSPRDAFNKLRSTAGNAVNRGRSYVADKFDQGRARVGRELQRVENGAQQALAFGRRQTGRIVDSYQAVRSNLGDRARNATNQLRSSVGTVAQSASAAGSWVVDRGRDAQQWAAENKDQLIAVGGAAIAGGLCMTVSFGAGAPACMAVAGATYGAITGWTEHCRDGQSAATCATGVAVYTGIGAVSGYGGGTGASLVAGGGKVGLRALAAGGAFEGGFSSAGTQLWNTGKINPRQLLQDTALGGLTGAGMHGIGRLGSKLRATRAPGELRTAGEMPRGGNGTVLRDGAGATPEEMVASRGGPTGGSRAGQADRRTQMLQETQDAGGPFECWRCGQTSTNPDNMHVGHRNVATADGGNLSPVNTCWEGAACNLGAGNRGGPNPGRSCAERGSCGAPYGRRD